MTPALIAYALAQIADVLTTLRALRRGGIEANPVIRWMMGRLGRYGWVVVKLAITAGIAAWLWSEGQAVGLLIVAGVTGLVALNNLRVR
ncbi:MAG: DUF5658 family protein [Pigmentiphaga sp.]|nr:DUF5658 family protein [Pigmentiphaga sp.]